jgi:hypothetical protein
MKLVSRSTAAAPYHQPGTAAATASDLAGSPLVLEEPEAARRELLLAELQAALSALGLQSIRARRHRLVLRYNDPLRHLPSGPVSPTLHIFGPDRTHVATTDGTGYQLDDGREFPVTEPAAAAAAICQSCAPPGQPAQAR